MLHKYLIEFLFDYVQTFDYFPKLSSLSSTITLSTDL